MFEDDDPVFPDIFDDVSEVPFEDDFDRRAAELTRKPYAGAQKVSPIMVRQGPWSGNNQLGSEVEFAPDANNEQTVLRMDEWGMPQAWSLMLGIDHADFTVDPTLLGITAHVVAGNGGTGQEFDVDWLAGTALTVNANAFNVIARYQASANIPTGIRLRVTAAQGKITAQRPTLTTQLASLVAGGGTVLSSVIRIPAFARSFMIVNRSFATADLYSANFHVLLKSDPVTAGTVGAIRGDQLLSFGANGFPISKFQRYLQLRLTNPGVSVSPTVVFFLGL